MVKAFQNFANGFGTCNGKMVFSKVIQFLPLGYKGSLKIFAFLFKVRFESIWFLTCIHSTKKIELFLIFYTCKNVTQLFSGE